MTHPKIEELIEALDRDYPPVAVEGEVEITGKFQLGQPAPIDSRLTDVATYEVDVSLDDLAAMSAAHREDKKKGRKGKHAVHFSSETDKHNTPRWLVERVRDCLGGIELDPATDASNPCQAMRFYTPVEDGLAQPWIARTVYMNCPYGRQIKQWICKLVEEYLQGNTREAIALVPARTDTGWWAAIKDVPALFVKGRLHFNEEENGAPFPSALLYFGPYWWKFRAAFGDIGQLYLPITYVEKEMR
jgi:phage N-6-adenine-methyltransferase